MVRAVAIAAVCAGCSFPGTGVDPDGEPPAIDARRFDAPIVPDAAPGLCGVPTEPALRLCIDFADGLAGDLARDGSGNGNDAALMAVTAATRGGSAAAHCAGDCEIRIAESGSLDLATPLSISVWVNADQAPGGGSRYGVLDNNTQYSLFYQDDDTVTCSVFRNQSQPTTVRSMTLVPGLWSHIACVANGATLAVYTDGAFGLSTTFTSNVHMGNDQGTLLGEDLESNGDGNETLRGGLDDVRIWNRALTATEICTLAEQTGC